MKAVNKQKNIEALNAFLDNNSIDPSEVMSQNNKLEIRYFVGDKRMMSEETRVGFNVVDTDDVSVYLFEINTIEFENSFKVSEDDFVYDDVLEILSITGSKRDKHSEPYTLRISSIYIEFV